MAKKHGEYLANDPDYVPDPEIEEFMELEISRAPKDPDMLAQRLRNNTAASPRDAGGDLDADWEDVNESGSETVAGDNPTPDQSLVEENASAMGVSYEDNEELEFIDKIEKRDRENHHAPDIPGISRRRRDSRQVCQGRGGSISPAAVEWCPWRRAQPRADRR